MPGCPVAGEVFCIFFTVKDEYWYKDLFEDVEPENLSELISKNSEIVKNQVMKNIPVSIQVYMLTYPNTCECVWAINTQI